MTSPGLRRSGNVQVRSEKLATVKSLVTYTKEEPLAYHANNFGGGGKIEVISKVPTRDVKDLTLAYSPGVAEVCREIIWNPEQIHTYTTKDNLVAAVTDSSAILGLGNIGPRAGIPVMEGKCVLFKNLAGCFSDRSRYAGSRSDYWNCEKS